MKIMIFFAVLTIPLMVGTMFTGYWLSTQKHKADQTKVQDTRQDLKMAQKDANTIAQKAVTPEECKTFKSKFELRIKANEIRITELNVKIKKPGERFDVLYEKKIANLEQQNKEMRARLEWYEKIQSNLESFKRKFNHVIDTIGESLKNLAVDNK
jgi:lipopolysaccharide export LptBFGC system permease protein LptF